MFESISLSEKLLSFPIFFIPKRFLLLAITPHEEKKKARTFISGEAIHALYRKSVAETLLWKQCLRCNIQSEASSLPNEKKKLIRGMRLNVKFCNEIVRR